MEPIQMNPVSLIDEMNYERNLIFTDLQFNDPLVTTERTNQVLQATEFEITFRGMHYSRVVFPLKFEQFCFNMVRPDPSWDFCTIMNIAGYCPDSLVVADKYEEKFIKALRIKTGELKELPPDSESDTELHKDKKLRKLNIFLKSSRNQQKKKKVKEILIEQRYLHRPEFMILPRLNMAGEFDDKFKLHK
jgi:hypothetical protein